MSLTNFPNGITSFGIPILGSGPILTTGNFFFANSSATNASDSNPADDKTIPAATIDGAIGKTTADNGDVVLVMPGHSEDPTSSIALDVASTWVYGLGWGTKRPTITFGALAAAFNISAAGCRVSNLIFDLGTVAATVTNAITVTAAGVIVEGCETVPHATSQFTNHLTATDVQHVIIRGNRFRTLHTASSTSGVVVDGCDDIQIIGNEISGHFSEHALDNTTPAAADEILRATIAYNYIKNDSTTAGDLAVQLDSAATGIFAVNMLSGGLATTAANFDIGNMSSLESYIVDDAGVDVHGIPLGSAAV